MDTSLLSVKIPASGGFSGIMAPQAFTLKSDGIAKLLEKFQSFKDMVHPMLTFGSVDSEEKMSDFASSVWRDMGSTLGVSNKVKYSHPVTDGEVNEEVCIESVKVTIESKALKTITIEPVWYLTRCAHICEFSNWKYVGLIEEIRSHFYVLQDASTVYITQVYQRDSKVTGSLVVGIPNDLLSAQEIHAGDFKQLQVQPPIARQAFIRALQRAKAMGLIKTVNSIIG